jgi:Ca2+-transporting ATPase
MQSTQEVASALGTSVESGLSSAGAATRQAEYGPNELVEKAGRSKMQILLEQFRGILTILLIAAALISAALGDWLEAVVILVIVVLNGVLGFVQENKAEQSIAALKRMAVPKVRVKRDGTVQEISARDIVPGDLVLLETGNIVPADGRLSQSSNLRIEEAALTGESEPVEKDATKVYDMEKPLGDRRNMVYSGTIVTYGRGEFLVTETGMATELGHIAGMLQSVTDEATPLQDRLDRLGKTLAYAALALVAVVFAVGYFRGQADLEELLLTSVSLAVAAVPEALTAVVTIALSLGAQRMLARNALIRKLPAVETLGSVTVICSDKTGTLTQNRMTVTVADIANHSFELVQDRTDPKLDLVPAEGSQIPGPGAQPTLELLMIAGAACNDAVLTPHEGEGGNYHAVGDPTEGALVLAAARAGLLKHEIETLFPRVDEVPFDSVRKRMTTLHLTPRRQDQLPASLDTLMDLRFGDVPPPHYTAFTKGAIDGLLSVASQVWVEGKLQPLDEHWRERVMAAHDALAQRGMRVLGVAIRGWDSPPAETTDEALEQDLILLGLFGLIDPPRAEVREAVMKCRTAGIRPVMITGDHPLTARHIAQQVGITESDKFVTGQDLDRMSPAELEVAAGEASVFARVSPEDKLRLIDALQAQNEIVSMTGDGVNDAPALKKADIGVAMGITGTDVAKGASDMVLLDDNFATIVAAVEEGRTIYDNIRRFIKYLLTCNTSEIAVMLVAPFLGMPLPLLPLQILWMNLVTDGLPALALGVEQAEPNVMKRPPYSPMESVFGRGMRTFIIVIGIVLSLVSIGSSYSLWHAGDPTWRTMLFTTLVFSQLAVAVAVRSEQDSVFKIGLLTNRSMVWAVLLTVGLQLLVIYLPLAQKTFDTTSLPLDHLAMAAGMSLGVFFLVELWKWGIRRKSA